VTILVDTGVLLAAANRRDRLHPTAVDWLDSVADTLAVTVPVIIETAWQIEANVTPAAEIELLTSIERGELDRVDLTDADWTRVRELVAGYDDLTLGTVDASIIAVAERLHVTTIATFNQRDFRVVRPAHVDAFALVPTVGGTGDRP